MLPLRPPLLRPRLAAGAALAMLVTGALAGCGSGAGAPRNRAEAVPSPAPSATADASATRSPVASAPLTVDGGATLRPKPQPTAEQVVRTARKHRKKAQVPSAPATPLVSEPFTVASFNTLGAVHTAHGGNKPGMAGGEVRTRRMISVLLGHGVDLVGLQEFETPQANVFRKRAGGTFAYWHPAGNSQNAIAWRRDRFALVAARTQPVHYFSGRIQPMPIVLLRDLRSPGFEFYVVNVHNPASTRHHPGNQRWRTLDMAREAAVIRGLVASGHPVLFTGDMNEKAEAFCAFTRGGYLRAAAGGSHVGGRCRPPAGAKIDWIFGSPHVLFNDYRVDRSPLVRRTTDHSVVLSQAQLVASGS